MLTLALAALAASAMVTADFADARRLGGGRTLGAQRQVQPAQPAQPPAATPAPNAPAGAAANPVMPREPAAAASRAAPGSAVTPPASGASRWLGPVAGIAAGLGLAALAHYLGISEALMSVLLVVVLAIVAIALLRWLFGRRAPAASRQMQYAGASAPASRPRDSFEPVLGRSGARTGTSTLTEAPQRGSWPSGFEPLPFLEQARSQFRRLQTAYDRGDRVALADVMTPEMFAEISSELERRGQHHPTDVVSLDAEILEVTTERDRHWASVRFSGLVREDGEATPKPFDELWHLVKPIDGSSGWLLAGIEQRVAEAGHA
jgi:predicted lipid-binding transport protein (Tim44 family)